MARTGLGRRRPRSGGAFYRRARAWELTHEDVQIPSAGEESEAASAFSNLRKLQDAYMRQEEQASAHEQSDHPPWSLTAVEVDDGAENAELEPLDWEFDSPREACEIFEASANTVKLRGLVTTRDGEQAAAESQGVSGGKMRTRAAALTAVKKFEALFREVTGATPGVQGKSDIIPRMEDLGIDTDMARKLKASLRLNKDGSCEYIEFAAACMTALEDQLQDDEADEEPKSVNIDQRGCGRGVPPVTNIERCAVVCHDGKTVTVAGDGVNLLWDRSSGWVTLGLVPFESVSSHYAPAVSGSSASREAGRRIARSSATRLEDPLSSITRRGGLLGATGTSKIHRRNEDAVRQRVLTHAQEVKEVQDAHLDPDFERFISRQMHTTVIHAVDLDITRRVYDVLEENRLVCGSPEEEIANFPNTPRGLMDLARRRAASLVSGTTPKSLAVLHAMKSTRLKFADEIAATSGQEEKLLREDETADYVAKVCSGSARLEMKDWVGRIYNKLRDADAKDDEEQTARESRPHQTAPAARAMGHQSAGSGAEGTGDPAFSAAAAAAPTGCWRLPSSAQSSVHRQSLALTCVGTHPELPRLVAGIGDGQLAIYELYRAHGERRPQLHQTQGFDASRRRGDVATALHVPRHPLCQEGCLSQDGVIVGFESGRVAVFRILPLEADRRSMDLLARARQHPSSYSDGSEGAYSAEDKDAFLTKTSRMNWGRLEPKLLPSEPLLLECVPSLSTVVSVSWQQTLGIVAVSAQGTVHATDVTGAQTWCIAYAAGRSASISCADLSPGLEQLALAGQRGVIHLWHCLTQTQGSRPGSAARRAARTEQRIAGNSYARGKQLYEDALLRRQRLTERKKEKRRQQQKPTEDLSACLHDVRTQKERIAMLRQRAERAREQKLELKEREEKLAEAKSRHAPSDVRSSSGPIVGHAGILDPSEKLSSPVLLVRYLPSNKRLVSVHQKCGTVLIWDVAHLELKQVLRTPGCRKATCAGWDARQGMLLVFGPHGVSERRIVKEGEPEERPQTESISWSPHKVH